MKSAQKDSKKKNINKNQKKLIIVGLLLLLLLVLAYLYVQVFAPKIKYRDLIIQANNCVQTGDLTSAENLYKEVLKADTDNYDALYGLVLVNMEKADYKTAKSYLNKVNASDQDSKSYKELQYRYSLKAEDYASAQSLMLAYPDLVKNKQEYNLVIEGLIAQNYYEQAAELYELAVSQSPDDNKLKQAGINIYLNLGDDAKVLTIFNSGVEDLTSAQFNAIAQIYQNRDDLDNLMKTLEKSLALNFEQAAVRDNLYRLYAQENQLAKLWNLRAKILQKAETVPELDKNIQGNSAANVRQSGMAAQQGSTIFYTEPQTHYIYKASESDPENAELIVKHAAAALNVQGEWIYFIDLTNNGNLVRTKIDGSNIETLWSQTKVIDPIVWGDKIYFINANNKLLYRINLDGSKPEQISQMTVYQFVLSPEYVYFLGDADRSIYKQNISKEAETEAELLLAGKFDSLNIDEFSQLYFLDLAQGGAIAKVDANGDNYSEIYQGMAEHLNYAEGKLYFVDWTPHVIAVDGSGLTNLASNFSAEMSVLREWIFSADASIDYGYYIYLFKKDGSNWSQLS